MTAYLDRSDRLSLLPQAAATATGKRFCSHHQGEVAASEGDFVMRNKTPRWVCFRCQKIFKATTPHWQSAAPSTLLLPVNSLLQIILV